MDYMIRAAAADDRVRAFAASTTGMVETARELHNTSPVVTAALGRLLTGGVMMGAMMKGEKDLLTLQVRGDGPMGGMIVTADSQGNAKGYAVHPDVILHANSEGKLDVGGAVGKGTLQVIRDLGLKEPYVGSTELISGEIAEDLTCYFAVSEQVPSSVGLGVLMNRDNTVRQAGGFILQLMPGTPDDVISRLETKLASIPPVTTMLDGGMSPEQILEELLGDMDLHVTDRMPVQFKCDCNEERIEKALVSIGRGELATMIKEGKPVEVCCQFCGKKYTFDKEQLRRLLDRAVK